jgi:hypothetical protein
LKKSLGEEWTLLLISNEESKRNHETRMILHADISDDDGKLVRYAHKFWERGRVFG